MYSTYRLNAKELNRDFIKGIKEIFHDREIEIIIHDVEDETTHILSSEINKKSLLKSIKEIEEGNVVTKTIEELEELAR